nr:retrovirus-related Pol polyprotein from transposon TNT 1-94 [Tanacetum cinerariifolium]
MYMETYKNVSQDIHDQLNAEAKAVQIILTGIDNDIYSTVDACPNACEIWKAIERLKQGESINVQYLVTNLYWEFGKFTSQDGESLESYYSRFYKMMNELIRFQCDVSNHQVNVQFLLQLQPEWQRFLTLVKQSQELKTVLYHKLYDILKQHQNEVNEIRAERIAQSSTRSQQVAIRNRGKAIVNYPQPIYDQEPSMVAEDNETSKDKEIDKLMALISLSFKKIYKPTNNNLRTLSNTSRANQDNSLRTNRGAGYDNQRLCNVAGARETIGTTVVQKYRIQCYNCKEFGHVARECQKPKRVKDAAYHREKMLLCKQEEAGIQLNAKQADWRDGTDDELEDQELEAHYMYMAQIQEVSPDAANSGPIFDAELLQKVSNDDHYNVFAIESEHPEQSKSVHDTYPIKQDENNVIIDSLDMSYVRKQIDQNDDDNDLANELEKLKGEIEDFKNKNISLESSNNRFKEANNTLSETNKLLYNDFKKSQAELQKRNNVEYASKVEIDCAKAKGDLISYKMKSQKSFNKYTQTINDLNQTLSEMKKKLCVHQETISILSQQKEAQIKLYKTREYKELDKVTTLENKVKLVEIFLFIVDYRCSKHMAGNLKLLINFVEKFLGTVYYVEGLNHNLFSVGQFCDADLEVAFRKSTCYIRDLKRNDLLTGSRGTDLYSITLQDTTSPNPICLMAKATSSQAWLWHRRLSHLNFDTINLLSKNDIVVGLPKLKYVKDHLCSSYELRKAKRKSFQSKTTLSSKRRLQLLQMDLCGPMRVANINGKKYVLVIVDNYSRYTWTHFLRSKDETPKVLIEFLRLVQRGLHAEVRIVQTDKGTELLNKTLHAYFDSKGFITKRPLLEHLNKTALSKDETVHLKKGDACIFVGYSTQSRAYRLFNKRKRVIVEMIHVNFDELPQMASDHVSFDPEPQCQRTTLEHDSLSPDLQCQENVTQADRTVTTSNKLDLLFSSMFDELLNGSSQVVSKSSSVTTADAPNQCQQQNTTPLNNQTTPDPTCQVPTHAPTVASTENMNQVEMVEEYAQVKNDEFINIFCTPVQDRRETSSRHVDSSNMHTFYQHHPFEHRWMKDHPLEQVIGNPSQSVRTRRQLESDAEMCMFIG